MDFQDFHKCKYQEPFQYRNMSLNWKPENEKQQYKILALASQYYRKILNYKNDKGKFPYSFSMDWEKEDFKDYYLWENDYFDWCRKHLKRPLKCLINVHKV